MSEKAAVEVGLQGTERERFFFFCNLLDGDCTNQTNVSALAYLHRTFRCLWAVPRARGWSISINDS
jgi:hypothetical protein